MPTKKTNGWNKYGYHVIEELKQQNTKIDCLQKDITELKMNFSALNVKSSVWGGLAGLLVAITALLLKLII